jgi:hypothetical protein
MSTRKEQSRQDEDSFNLLNINTLSHHNTIIGTYNAYSMHIESH